ncbi:DUF4349 domain-containing protein [Mucilaginibacter gynuensis]|uniref:DUF4349 domain-containing protein n=1 Tax=Mucilaginibacter gynuensis TaxID=1302236 RepID=A0ABP8GI98_9SPHI
MKTSILFILLSGAVLLFSCKNSAEYKALNSNSSDTALVAADSATSTQNKLIKTADISFKVKDVTQTGERISALAAHYNGMVTHHQMQSEVIRNRDIELGNDSMRHVSAFNTTADMTVRIPSPKLEEFMNTVSHMGIYVNFRKMDIEDKTLDYLSSQMKLDSRAELVKQQKNGKLVVKHPEDIPYFKDELVDEQINNRRIDDAVKYSVVTIGFYQSNTIVQEVVANDDVDSYHIPFLSQMKLSLLNGLDIFITIVVALTNLWVFILLGVAVWLAIRAYRKKNPLLLPNKTLTDV